MRSTAYLRPDVERQHTGPTFYDQTVRVTRQAARYLATLAGWGVAGASIYYVIMAAYALLATTGVFLLSRPGWLPFLAGWIVLLDGLVILLVLLHRWAMR